MSKIRILQIADVNKNKASGLSFSIPTLIDGFIKNNIIVTLYNLSNKNNENIKDLLKSHDIIVINSYFRLDHLKILFFLPRKKILILTPRGAFSKKNKYNIQKYIYSIIYWWIIKVRRLRPKIHYLTESESNLSRFRSNKYFIIGNSIKPTEITNVITTKNLTEKINIIYIGRFSLHIKGLDILIEHIEKYNNLYLKNNVEFNLYGPESPGKNKLRNLIFAKDISNVFIHDEVYGEEKKRILSLATFHILVSRSEGFPMSVLESLANGIPQILSKGTNLLPLIDRFKCGYYFDDNLVYKLINIDNNSYKEMQLHSIECAKVHQNIDVAKSTLDAYLK